MERGSHFHKSHLDPSLALLMLHASLALRLTLALSSFLLCLLFPQPLQTYNMIPYLSAHNLPLPEVEQLLYIIMGILCSLFCEMTGRAFCVFCPFFCWVLFYWFVGVFMYSGANPPSVAHVRNISSQHVDCLCPLQSIFWWTQIFILM